MKKIEVQWFQSKYSLSEISQGSGFLFSFLSAPRDGNKQTHQYIKCRDFLHDAIRSHITGKPCPVYGFIYTKGTDPPIDMRRTRLLVTKAGSSEKKYKETMQEIKCGLKIVNYFENIMEIKPSKLYKVSNSDKPTWIFNGSGVWMKAPALISLYTFLIRLGYQKIDIDTYQDFIEKVAEKERKNNVYSNRDPKYLKTIGDKLITVAENYKELFCLKQGKAGQSYDPIYTEDIKIHVYHDYSGILSLCDGKHIETLKSSKRLFALLEKEKEESA